MLKRFTNIGIKSLIFLLLVAFALIVLSYQETVQSKNEQLVSLQLQLASKDKLLLEAQKKAEQSALVFSNFPDLQLESGVLPPSAAQPTNIAKPTPTATASDNDRFDNPADNAQIDFKISTKISAISKFVPLSDQQKQRLKTKFETELLSPQAESESLDEILGTENAEFYRQQRKKAFEQVLQESIEKEVLFIAEKLRFEKPQEDAIRTVFTEVEEEIKNRREMPATEGSKDIKTTMQKMIEEERLRNTLLADRLKTVLNSDQYQQFLQYQSGTQDMGLWHGE